MDPTALFFFFGVLAGRISRDFKLPPALYDIVTVVLLLAIGLKGGVELSHQPVLPMLGRAGVVMLLGLLLPLPAFALLRGWGGLPRVDAAAVAAHYGSVSVGTFAVAVSYLQGRGIPFEEYTALFVVVLEVPAILVGLVLARGARGTSVEQWKALLLESVTGKSILLLLGGLIIGWIGGDAVSREIGPFFFILFKGFLALFLLEMGLIVAERLHSLRQAGAFLVGFGLLFPPAAAALSGAVAWAIGLSPGGVVLVATLGASASYIAVPAALRVALPEANPALSITASLAVTFPFNILAGIPLYTAAVHHLLGS